MPTFNRAGTSLLAPVAYVAAALLVAVPLCALVTLYPPAWHAGVWRVAATGMLMGMLVLPVAGAAAALFTAKALGHRRTLAILAAADGILALGIVLTLLIFGADTVQVRGEMLSAIGAGVVRADGLQRFDMVIGRVVVEGALAAWALAAIGVHGWRAATALAHVSSIGASSAAHRSGASRRVAVPALR